jgi:hypothetical protein
MKFLQETLKTNNLARTKLFLFPAIEPPVYARVDSIYRGGIDEKSHAIPARAQHVTESYQFAFHSSPKTRTKRKKRNVEFRFAWFSPRFLRLPRLEASYP